MRLTVPLAACAALVLSACGSPDDDGANQAAAPIDDAAGVTEAGADALPPSDQAGDDATSTPAATDTDGNASVPIAVRGRWGLVPADCTSTRGDAKGLIEVSAQQVKFYESVATLANVEERSPASIRADWSFIGEGMTWSRDMTLTVQSGGDQLVRREFGEDAMDQALTYTKCG